MTETDRKGRFRAAQAHETARVSVNTCVFVQTSTRPHRRSTTVSGIDSEHSAMLCESMAEVNQLIRDLGVGTYHALIPEFSAEQIAAMTDDEVEACCDL